MPERKSHATVAHADSYAPKRRTALVLTGTGTAGVYHAGVLRALHEAGVKLDVVAGRGIGVMGALFTAVDGGQRLWEEKGFWRTRAVGRLYGWRGVLHGIVWCLAAAVLLVVLPLAVMVVGLVVFPLDFLLQLVGVSLARGLVGSYVATAEAAFSPEALPTWLPRLALVALAAGAGLAVFDGWRHRGSRRRRGALWWRALGAPLSAAGAVERCWQVVWDLMRGAAQLKQPDRAEVGRRYAELLTENLGQPGFRELLLIAHDLDANRDLLFVLASEVRRATLFSRPTTREVHERRGEVLDLSGVGRDYVADAVAAALAVPLVTDAHTLRFASEGYWRGETHRLCDRPGSVTRLIEELIGLDVEQVILVSAAPESPGPHALRPPRVDGRGRLGEYLLSSEAAAVRDVIRAASAVGLRLYPIRPLHNPLGPFDFGGGFDDRSDRSQPLPELMSRGYEDAYHQFIEPVLGASGERVGQDTL